MRAQTDDDTIAIAVSIHQPIGQVWNTLTQPNQMARWWGPDTRLEPRSGGQFREQWVDDGARVVVTRGQVLSFSPPTELALSWADEDWPSETLVKIRLTEDRNGTTLNLSHSGWATLPNSARLREKHAAGWRDLLAALKKVAES